MQDIQRTKGTQVNTSTRLAPYDGKEECLLRSYAMIRVVL